MELWIRSQDKEILLKTTSLCIEIQYDVDPKLHTFNIFANGIKVGNYKTKERALEVLDEIQSKIKSKQLIETKNTYSWSDDKLIECRTLAEVNKVYEMPKE